MSKVTAVIPAAGKGTRLGSSVPKVFTEIVPFVSPWSILKAALTPLVDHIELVLAPPVAKLYGDALKGIDGGVGISEQPESLGMGDAVFCADWHDADTIVVVWGDQIGIHPATVIEALCFYGSSSALRRVTIPVVMTTKPYVEYIFDGYDHLEGIRETREGDVTHPEGWSDVGVFVLPVEGLRDAWIGYLTEPDFWPSRTKKTGEVSFLQFLVYLAQHNWEVIGMGIENPDEARGLNTPEDLEWARERFAK